MMDDIKIENIAVILNKEDLELLLLAIRQCLTRKGKFKENVKLSFLSRQLEDALYQLRVAN